MAAAPRRKEVYTYEAPFPLYSLACSQVPGSNNAFRFAVGSFIEEYSNKVQVVQVDDEKNELVCKYTFDHPYPTTKIQWAPEPLATQRDLLATSGDYLRLWSVNPSDETPMKFEAVFSNTKSSEYCAPVTAFDWNLVDQSIIAAASIDTTCTIWDINVRKVKTQLIAHDKEVYDLAWSGNKDIFATVGADGSLRMFDLRSLEHSTIMFETPGSTPLLRLSWNTLDINYIAAFAADSPKAFVLDTRMPATPVAELGGHTAAVNAVAWAPHSACHICTVSDDYQALIWDLSCLPKPVEDPILAYSADAEVSNMVWSRSLSERVTIACDNKVQSLLV